MKAYKYRIYPTRNQTNILNNMFDECRELYNYFLNQRIQEYKTNKKSISKNDQINQITKLKEEKPELKEIYSQVLQDVVKRLDKAYQNFFRRVKKGEKPGFPRFKGKGWYNSITYPQNNGSFKLVEDNRRIKLSGIGSIKIKYHRDIQGEIKTCTVVRSTTGKWYVTICCDSVSKKVLKKTGKEVGIDVGLKTFAVLSNGKKIPRKRFFQGRREQFGKRAEEACQAA